MKSERSEGNREGGRGGGRWGGGGGGEGEGGGGGGGGREGGGGGGGRGGGGGERGEGGGGEGGGGEEGRDRVRERGEEITNQGRGRRTVHLGSLYHLAVAISCSTFPRVCIEIGEESCCQ